MKAIILACWNDGRISLMAMLRLTSYLITVDELAEGMSDTAVLEYLEILSSHGYKPSHDRLSSALANTRSLRNIPESTISTLISECGFTAAELVEVSTPELIVHFYSCITRDISRSGLPSLARQIADRTLEVIEWWRPKWFDILISLMDLGVSVPHDQLVVIRQQAEQNGTLTAGMMNRLPKS